MREPVFSHDWISNNFPLWEDVLVPRLAGKPITGLEIGCYEGRSTLWFMEHIFTHQDSHLLCVDTFEGSQDHWENNIDFSGVYERFRFNLGAYINTNKLDLLCQDSSEFLLNECDYERFLPFDFVFIDGSHLAADVLLDLVLTWRLMASGGIMVIDDYGWGSGRPAVQTPKPAVDGFMDCYEGRYTVLHEEYQVILQKR